MTCGGILGDRHEEHVNMPQACGPAPNQILIRGLDGVFSMVGGTGALVFDEEQRPNDML
ncbi:MAG: hypothetical protein ACKV2T_17705 [Kofleriaceae bacterium]